ncbi:hypothetical protein CEXT_714561 [Caerostris extrusa]|uniref:Uncharacterized protein n=1 Tax=Caerostris extrusa TaxID=172846 RepID=A0AAV4PLK9_CAEEX|nr:hypothetical protein CEXT_714561 [Caerostris extrusa]
MFCLTALPKSLFCEFTIHFQEVLVLLSLSESSFYNSPLLLKSTIPIFHFLFEILAVKIWSYSRIQFSWLFRPTGNSSWCHSGFVCLRINSNPEKFSRFRNCDLGIGHTTRYYCRINILFPPNYRFYSAIVVLAFLCYEFAYRFC